MSKMVIFNCPAYKGLTRDIPDWLDNTNCGYYTGQVPCQDCTDCVMKRVIGKCIELYNMECKNPYKTNGYMLAFDILKEMDIQEVE